MAPTIKLLEQGMRDIFFNLVKFVGSRHTGLWPQHQSLLMKFFYIIIKPWSWNPSRYYTTLSSVLLPGGIPTYGLFRHTPRKASIQWLLECSQECCQAHTFCEINFYFVFETEFYISRLCLKVPISQGWCWTIYPSASTSQAVGILLNTSGYHCL